MLKEYRFRSDIPKEEYEQFVQSHQLCNLLQSYDWAKVKNNWDHVYAGVYDKNKLAATGLLLIKPLPFSLTKFYLPKVTKGRYWTIRIKSYSISFLKT